MSAPGEICAIFQHRTNPNSSSPLIHEYAVLRTNKSSVEWESMEQILGIDESYPMKEYCNNKLINEYHEYIMEFAKKFENKNKNKNKNKNNNDNEIFIPRFDIECILDERQNNNNNIEFKIRWKGWPKQYDSWIPLPYLDKHSLKLVDKFRRNSNKLIKNLGSKGFPSDYWKELYASEWQKYMDGMDNGNEHSDYAFYFFKRFGIQIDSIADFGFGQGDMFDAFAKKFKPKVAYGLEPSKYAFDMYCNNFNSNLKENKSYFNGCHLHLECIDLIEYFKRENMTKEQVKMYNEKYKERKNNENKCKNKKNKKNNNSMDIDSENNNIEQDMKEIMEDKNYKEFCYCARGNNKKFYQKKQEKILQKFKNKNLNKKNKIKLNKFELGIYDAHPCSCYKKFDGSYSLGLCVSVLQYLNDNNVDNILCKLSKHCDFLYFDVVTNEEYNIMSSGSTFKDKWAIQTRTKHWYWSIIFKYWRIIGNQILESKYFFPNDKDSNIPNTIYIVNQNDIKYD